MKNDNKTENKQETENHAENIVQEPVVPINTTNQITEFTEEQLSKAWQKYSDKIKETNPRIFSMLTAQPPVLKENNLVEFNLNNPLQEDVLQKIKFDLVNFLRNELLNNKIELSTTISELQQSQRFYTDKEKFDHMAQKHPNLLKFKQQFGLDFG